MHPNFKDSSEFIIAHFSPNEIEDLNRLQGGEHKDEETQLPSFKPLLERFMHPQIQSNIHMLRGYTGKKAPEGVGKFIEQSGRFGDTKAAVLPRILGDMFDDLLNDGKPSINPRTGKREYFLGDLFGGISNLFNTVTSPVRSAVNSLGNAVGLGNLGNMGGQLINQFSPAIGGLVNKGVSALGNTVGNAVGLGNIGDSIGQFAGNTVSDLARGVGGQLMNGNFDPMSLAKEGISKFGGSMGPMLETGLKNFAPTIGNMAQAGLMGAGEAFGLPPALTMGVGQLANNGVQSLANWGGEQANKYLSNMNSPEQQPQLSQMPESASRYVANDMAPTWEGIYGSNPASAAMGSAMANYGNGSSMYDSANQGLSEGINRIENPGAQYLARGAYNTANNMNNGEGFNNSLASGFNNINPELLNNARNYGVQKFNNMISPFFNRRAAI